MPSEPSQNSENRTSEPQQLKRVGAAGRIIVIFLAAVVTFLAVFAIGSIIGTRVSATGGPVNEHHMGHGVVTGLVGGVLCSLAVAVMFSRRLFPR
jgi:hypothetical protein